MVVITVFTAELLVTLLSELAPFPVRSAVSGSRGSSFD